MFWWLKKQADLYGRSGRWATIRRQHLEREPACAACGRAKNLEVHHIQPYHERPELELDPENLVTLCADPCHLTFGHLLNFKRSNPHVREDAAAYRRRIDAYGDGP